MLEHVQLAQLIERCRTRAKLGRAAMAPASTDELEAAVLALASQCTRMSAALEWYSKVTPRPSHSESYLVTYPILAQMILSGAEHETIEQAAELVPSIPADPDAMKVLSLLKVETAEAEIAGVSDEP